MEPSGTSDEEQGPSFVRGSPFNHGANATLTDAQVHVLGFGGAKEAFDTPSLRAVALSPPYSHDGSAKSLDVLLADRHDRMGKLSALSASQRRALLAYLRTL